MAPDTEEKVRRNRIPLSERFAKLDKADARLRAAIQKNAAKRVELVAQAKAKAAQLLADAGVAQHKPDEQ